MILTSGFTSFSSLALSLQTVKPISKPIGKLLYFDYVYSPTLLELRRMKINKVMRKHKIKRILNIINETT